MSLKQFLDKNNVQNIDKTLIQTLDTTAAQIITTSYGVASGIGPAGIALPTVGLIVEVPKAVAQSNGVGLADVAGLMQFMTALSADIDAQIITKLTAGANLLAVIPPGIGGPGGPVVPIALAAGPSATNLGFGKALLQWAVSLLPSGDLRVISPFIA